MIEVAAAAPASLIPAVVLVAVGIGSGIVLAFLVTDAPESRAADAIAILLALAFVTFPIVGIATGVEAKKVAYVVSQQSITDAFEADHGVSDLLPLDGTIAACATGDAPEATPYTWVDATGNPTSGVLKKSAEDGGVCEYSLYVG